MINHDMCKNLDHTKYPLSKSGKQSGYKVLVLVDGKINIENDFLSCVQIFGNSRFIVCNFFVN